MVLDDKKFKEIMTELEFSNDEKAWLRECVRKHDSLAAAEPQIHLFLKHKLKGLEDDLGKIEAERKKIREELDELQKNFIKETRENAKKKITIAIGEYDRIKTRQKLNLEKIRLHSGKLHREIEAYKLRFTTEKEQKELTDIRKKLV